MRKEKDVLLNLLFWSFIAILIFLLIVALIVCDGGKNSVGVAICLLSAVISTVGICLCILGWKAICLLSNEG